MRNLRLLALIAPVLALLPVAAACEDSSSSSGGQFTVEAGPGFEAGSTPSPEAGPEAPDAADAFVPPVIKGVTVTVTPGVNSNVGVRVILHDASGAVIGETKTDATGKAVLPTAPSMVTVLTIHGTNEPAPVTFMGVADGDKLTVLTPVVTPNPVQLGSYAVTLTDSGATDGTTLYEVFTAGSACYSSNNVNTAPISLLTFDYCVPGAKGTVLARASSTGSTLAYAFGKDLAKPAGGGAVNVAASVFKPKGATTVLGTHVPASQTLFGAARLGGIANGTFFEFGGVGGSLADGVVFDTATDFAEAYQTQVTLGGPSSARSVLVRRDPTTAPASSMLPAFDFDTMLPLLSTTNVTTPVAGRADITMTSVAPTTGADLGVVEIRWFNTPLDSSLRWKFVVPPGTTSLSVPALPADLAMTAPANSITIHLVTFIDAPQLTGYGQAKVLPIPSEDDLDAVKIDRPLPAGIGTVRFTQINPDS